MTSVVHYKFKNQDKKWETLQFDGPVISVNELKRQIAQRSNLGQAGDFDLVLSNQETGFGANAMRCASTARLRLRVLVCSCADSSIAQCTQIRRRSFTRMSRL